MGIAAFGIGIGAGIGIAEGCEGTGIGICSGAAVGAGIGIGAFGAGMVAPEFICAFADIAMRRAAEKTAVAVKERIKFFI